MPMTSRLRAAVAGAMLTLAALPPALAQAPAWPAKPITVVMGYGPGSGADIEARLYAPHLQAALGQPVIVEGKPGAGGRAGHARDRHQVGRAHLPIG